MGASRLLGAAAACVILLSFAAEHRKSYWNGCIQAAIVICQQIFVTLALVIFLLKILLQNASKSSFFCFGVEIWFWSCNFRHRCAYFYCVLQLSLCRSHCSGSVKVARCRGCMRKDRKSYWNGCIKAATVICQQIFAILALVIFLLKFLLKSASKSSFCRFGAEIHPVLELQFPMPLRVVLLCFATQSLQIAL